MVSRIRKSFRLNWVRKEISNSVHKQVVASIWKFRLVLLLNLLIPGMLRAFPVRLRLKEGGVFQIKQFMTLFVYKEIFVDNCYDYPRLKSDKPVIIDVGANTGLFVIRMKQLYPASFIYGLEPFAENYRDLQKNLGESRLSGYKLFQSGLGGRTRKDKLFIHHGNVAGHSLVQSLTGGSDYVEIDLLDIKSLLSNVTGGRCDLMKLDCEGAEYEIIKSIDKETATRIESIVFETHAVGYDVKDLIKHLNDVGYRVELNENSNIGMALYNTGRAAA